MEWTEEGLRAEGFCGFVRFADSGGEVIPRDPGVYAVVRTAAEPPTFLNASPAGHFKGKDPTVARALLETAWVQGTPVVYIGKASAGKTGRRGLRPRLASYRRFGQGESVGHWGGRYIWQLADHQDLVLAWRPTPDEDPETVESWLISEFVEAFGLRPFANRKLGRFSRPLGPESSAE